MMLAPSYFFVEKQTPVFHTSTKNQQVALLREYIVGNLDQPINLTQMEAISGLSARVLQKEFKSTYDCSPIQWLREQRLSKASQLLRNPSAGTTVSSVAAACGFDDFSEFARRYRALYHELPSETLKKSLLGG